MVRMSQTLRRTEESNNHPNLSFIIGVPADTALALVSLPLPRKAPAVDLVIIKIRRIIEAVSPHCGPGRRLNQSSVPRNQGGQKKGNECQKSSHLG